VAAGNAACLHVKLPVVPLSKQHRGSLTVTIRLHLARSIAILQQQEQEHCCKVDRGGKTSFM
jgi:hypothetical protein